MHLQILDLDGAVAAQQSLREVAPWTSVDTLPLRDLGARLRLWSRDATMKQARQRITSATRPEPILSLLGSGDYHHLAVLLMEQVREPFTVIHIDNHPDWVRLAPRWHCGSWVNQALRLPQVAKVVTLGPCSDDLVHPDLKGGNLRALGAGRINLFPWQHAPSRIWRQIEDGPGHRYENGRLIWRNLAQMGIEQSVNVIIPLVETEAVWLSIDKDVLPEQEALTNWDQGQMPLAAVLRVICAIGAHKRIVGADICGEFSRPQHRNPLKRWEAHMDQPRHDAPEAGLLARNEHTNRELLVAIEQASRLR
jgi:arginase family enzyme